MKTNEKKEALMMLKQTFSEKMLAESQPDQK